METVNKHIHITYVFYLNTAEINKRVAARNFRETNQRRLPQNEHPRPRAKREKPAARTERPTSQTRQTAKTRANPTLPLRQSQPNSHQREPLGSSCKRRLDSQERCANGDNMHEEDTQTGEIN